MIIFFVADNVEAKSRPEADRGSDHELLITEFRFNWRT